MCKNINQIKTAAQSIQTGKGADGRKIDIKKIKDRLPFFDAVADACANPNLETCFYHALGFAIAAQLNARKVATARGGKWTHVQVRQILART
jgi:recombinase